MLKKSTMTITALIQANPKTGIILISLAMTALLTAVRAFLSDKKRMREIKTMQEEIRKEMKIHKDNPDKMLELNSRMMEHFPEQMKQAMKIMLITMIPLIIIFSWVRETFALTSIASSWIWWYIGFSVLFGFLFGKIFKLN